MIYAMPDTQHGLPCIQICEGDEPFPVEAAYPVIDGIMCENWVIDGGVLREKTDAEKQQYQDVVAAEGLQLENDRQAAKSDELKAVENEFISFCDMVTPSTSHNKLSIEQLNSIGAQIPDPQVYKDLMLKLLAIDAKVKTLGGNRWWDDCIWHQEIVR